MNVNGKENVLAQISRYTRKKVTYEMAGYEFVLLPRTIRRIKDVSDLISEQRLLMSEFSEKSLDEIVEENLEAPMPEYMVEWEIFKIITEGPHDDIEKDLESLMDLDVVENAISDFFSSSKKLGIS
ncbi:MAG: hypothetical protein KatS3mg104_2957 [Phycisphaerae bacterium]|nr:MAG: hypothetical protein KatS3mg104_2957 [Phycisphaerae bacterium]